MRSAVKKRESLCEGWVSQSKQVFWVFTANVDERALADVQHPSLSKKGNTKVEHRGWEGSPQPRSQGGAGLVDGSGCTQRLLLPAGKALRLPPKSQAECFPCAFYN